MENLSIKCKDLKIEAQMSLEIQAHQTAIFATDIQQEWKAGAMQVWKSAATQINGMPTPPPQPPMSTPSHKHPPCR